MWFFVVGRVFVYQGRDWFVDSFSKGSACIFVLGPLTTHGSVS